MEDKRTLKEQIREFEAQICQLETQNGQLWLLIEIIERELQYETSTKEIRAELVELIRKAKHEISYKR